MKRSKIYNFKSRVMIIVFLFLNAVCMATPAIKNTFENEGQPPIAQFISDFNSIENEEAISETSTFINNRKAHSLNKKIKESHPEKNYLQGVSASVENRFSAFINYCAFLPTPHYYTFLFRYKPF